jgi:dihydroorotase
LELYAEVFDAANKLENLEKFASCNGPAFYRLPKNTETISLEKTGWEVPSELTLGNEKLAPLRDNETIAWKMVGRVK